MSTLVRRATRADLDELAAILSDGFARDPLFVWIYGTEQQHHRSAPAFFRWMAGRTLDVGHAYIADGKAALLGQPSWTVETGEEADAAMRRQLRDVAGEYADNLLAFFDAAGQHHPMARPHWYGTFLATRSEHRSEAPGVSVFRYCFKDQGAPIYLESTTVRNQAIYAKIGFRPIGSFKVAGQVELTQMWREPGATGESDAA